MQVQGQIEVSNEAVNEVEGVNQTNDEEIPWVLIESYFKERHLERLVRHQLESYNHFVGYQINKTIEMFNPIHIKSDNDLDPTTGKHFLELTVTFENFNIYRPQIYENNGAIKIMFPQEARLRNFTYSSAMTVDVRVDYTIREGENLETVRTLTKVLPKIHIGKIPIMVKSNICVLSQYKHVEHTGECRFDTGGYFIINGSEKTVLGQERPAENRVYCFNISKNDAKYSWKAEIKSVPDYKCISPKQINLFLSSKNNGFGYPITVQIPRVRQPIPLFVVFRALNVLSDRDICEHILLHIPDETDGLNGARSRLPMLQMLQASVIDANKYLNYEEAIRHINTYVGYTSVHVDKEVGMTKKRQFTLDVLQNDLFPHCRTVIQKRFFLGYMTSKLISAAFGWTHADDRDSYVNKRVDLTGTSLNNLFRNHFNKLVKDMEKLIVKEINNGCWRSKEDYLSILNMTNINNIIKPTTIENGFRRALSTGDFGIKHTNSNKVGVAQVLNRLTYMASLSHLRRVSTPSDKSGKSVLPRKLHNTSWGYLCPAETPEGQSVGIVKSLSYMAHVTVYSDSTSLYDYVKPFMIALDSEPDANAVKPRDLFGRVRVFVNGAWVGVAIHAIEMFRALKRMKSQGIINVYTSVVFDYSAQEIRVCNDSGRVTRPLLRLRDVGDGLSKSQTSYITEELLQRIRNQELSWDDLMTSCKLEEAVIEYVDAEEQSHSLIATSLADVRTHSDQCYTHCEIHPSTIFGIVASCIPFPDHNQSPRNTYQCAQGKQAMGMYATNFQERMDKTAYVMTYGTRPLVDTRVMNIIQLDQMPAGCNVTVAIMTHTGYNQEDSLLLSKGAVDRGLMQITLTHTEKDEDKQKINGDEEVRCKPDSSRTKGMKFGNYNKVNARGFMPENTLVENRDVIIAKVIPIKENRNDQTKLVKFEDYSKIYKTVEETYIDRNYTDKNADGYNFAKVRVRALRKPVIGDKFSSRSSQKGTVGNIIPEEDMPFTASGIRPDIIINPHAIPSRMTIAQLKETLLGKVLVTLGMFGDGTSFGNLDVETISNHLLQLGYEAHGNELMYNGLTGQQLECSVFVGPVFYQRLKHMVNDKQHSRASGPMVKLTRQPAEGRSRDGGLRYGEMERDCTVAHGAARFTKERLYDVSDKYSVHVCNRCGLIASYNHKLQIHCCRTCDNRTDFAYVEIPYACKLLFQELSTMSVVPRLMAE